MMPASQAKSVFVGNHFETKICRFTVLTDGK